MNALVQSVEAPFLEIADLVSPELRVKRAALTAFSFVSAVFAAATAAAISVSILPAACFSVVLPLAALAFFSFKVASFLKDYQDPEELQKMKEEAKGMGFSELLEEHRGIEPILAHQICDLETLRAKFFLEHQDKSTSQILSAFPLSLLLSHRLMSQQQMRSFVCEELSLAADVSDLEERLGEKELEDLKNAKVISSQELELLTSLKKAEEGLRREKKEALLTLQMHCWGRRDSILAHLEQQEKKKNEEIQKLYSQNSPLHPYALKILQEDLQVIQKERIRIEKDVSIGREMQKQYEEMLGRIEGNFEKRKKAHQENLQKVRQYFLSSI